MQHLNQECYVINKILIFASYLNINVYECVNRLVGHVYFSVHHFPFIYEFFGERLQSTSVPEFLAILAKFLHKADITMKF